jgi:hypothetical protein
MKTRRDRMSHSQAVMLFFYMSVPVSVALIHIIQTSDTDGLLRMGGSALWGMFLMYLITRARVYND